METRTIVICISISLKVNIDCIKNCGGAGHVNLVRTYRFVLELPPQFTTLLGDLGDLDAGVLLQDGLALLVQPQHEGGRWSFRRVHVLLTFL